MKDRDLRDYIKMKQKWIAGYQQIRMQGISKSGYQEKLTYIHPH
jgi:hypothetical protein